MKQAAGGEAHRLWIKTPSKQTGLGLTSSERPRPGGPQSKADTCYFGFSIDLDPAGQVEDGNGDALWPHDAFEGGGFTGARQTHAKAYEQLGRPVEGCLTWTGEEVFHGMPMPADV